MTRMSPEAKVSSAVGLGIVEMAAGAVALPFVSHDLPWANVAPLLLGTGVLTEMTVLGSLPRNKDMTRAASIIGGMALTLAEGGFAALNLFQGHLLEGILVGSIGVITINGVGAISKNY